MLSTRSGLSFACALIFTACSANSHDEDAVAKKGARVRESGTHHATSNAAATAGAPDEASAKRIASEYYRSRINAKGPDGEPEIIKWNENWKVAWGRVWIMVNVRTGESFQADSGTD